MILNDTFINKATVGIFCACTSNLNTLCLAMFEFGTLLLGIIAKISAIESSMNLSRNLMDVGLAHSR